MTLHLHPSIINPSSCQDSGIAWRIVSVMPRDLTTITETNQPVSQPNIKPVSQSEVRPDSHTSKQSETKCKHWSGCQLAKTALYNRQHGWTTLYRIAKRYVSQRHFCCDVEIFSTCSVFTRRWTEIVKTTSSETVAWWNAVSHFKYPKKTVTRTKLRNLRRQSVPAPRVFRPTAGFRVFSDRFKLRIFHQRLGPRLGIIDNGVCASCGVFLSGSCGSGCAWRRL